MIDEQAMTLPILISGVMIAFTAVGAGAKRLLKPVFGLSIAAAPNPASTEIREGF